MTDHAEDIAHLNAVGERVSRELSDLDSQINRAVVLSEHLQAEAEDTSDPDEVARLEREISETEDGISALREEWDSVATQLPNA